MLLQVQRLGAYWGYKLSKRHLNISRQDNIEITPFVGTKSGWFNTEYFFLTPCILFWHSHLLRITRCRN